MNKSGKEITGLHRPSAILVIMGVAGCGKTTIGRELSARLGHPFVEGDQFHSAQAVERMRRGIALTDAERFPWLDRIARAANTETESAYAVIIACSALKRSYRDHLRMKIKARLAFLHPSGSPTLIAERLQTRGGHFFNPALSKGQFATLEPLEPDEPGVTLDIGALGDAISGEALRRAQSFFAGQDL